MRTVIEILEERISQAICKVTGEDGFPAIVKPSAESKFGDYQANGVMGAAKKLGQNPRELAGKIVEELELSDICEEPEIAGPGFINLRLRSEFISERLFSIANDDSGRLGVDKVSKAKKVVVDFSGPNIAKQMHVGHLRSTIIGDCICRMLEFAGHDVIRQNHIGDWGTQFGMLIALLRDEHPDILEDIGNVKIADLEEFYKKAKVRCDEDETFAKKARDEVIKLHNHDKDTIRIWQHIVDESRRHYQPIYDILGVNLDKKNERGESFYARQLGKVVDDLKGSGLAVDSDGAVCIFPEGFENKHGKPLPFIIQKSDGAFLYATTDLAAIRYRIERLGADEIIYVTDARQQLHFSMLFAVAKMAGWTNDNKKLLHVTFGTMLGEDGRPFKTRSGENVKLKDLLDEAVDRALTVVTEKNPELSDEEKVKIAKAVGIGAVKYADFSNNRTTDYVFSFDKMLAMEGNTAPYMQYAYARVKSIGRKAEQRGVDVPGEINEIKKLILSESTELELAKHLLRYGEAISGAIADCRCNYLTSYLYDLAQKFSSFYTSCPVLGVEGEKRGTRLMLCDITAKTIKHGLCELLGIEVVEQM